MPFRALIDACWKEKYTTARFTRDLIAGITVGIIAIPLAMALAIGSGVPPQYGLYTLSLIHISEPTRLGMISYAVFCLKKKKNKKATVVLTIKHT